MNRGIKGQGPRTREQGSGARGQGAGGLESGIVIRMWEPGRRSQGPAGRARDWGSGRRPKARIKNHRGDLLKSIYNQRGDP